MTPTPAEVFNGYQQMVSDKLDIGLILLVAGMGVLLVCTIAILFSRIFTRI